MISEPREAQLASLSEAEITNLVEVVPRLADSWAATGTDAGQLERGHPQALTALLAAMATHQDQLLASRDAGGRAPERRATLTGSTRR